MKFYVIYNSRDNWSVGAEYIGREYNCGEAQFWLQFIFFEIGIGF